MRFLNYDDLDVWKECRKLVSEIYIIKKDFPKEGIYGLTNQLRRALISNIAKGTLTNTIKETLQFFYIYRGSLFESEEQFIIAKDLNYISEKQLKEILLQFSTCKNY